jgi:circadian clock protein KaiB
VKPKTSTKAFQDAEELPSRRVVLRLYVTGSSDRSIRAIQNAKEICDEYLTGLYELDVVDIHKQPELAHEDEVLAIPTLIKKTPLPMRRFIGDLSNREMVLVGLDVKPKQRR